MAVGSNPPGSALLGTRLRHLLELMEDDVAGVYADLGLAGFRPRFTPIVRLLHADGPHSIRDIAVATGVTHSAASQTIAQMVTEQLVILSAGSDARTRFARLTPKATRLIPALDAEWAATTAAAVALEAELSAPLSEVVDEALAALRRQSMRDRIAAVTPSLDQDTGRARTAAQDVLPRVSNP